MAVPLLPTALRVLLEDFERLPGIGPKSAQRIVLSLLRQSEERLTSFGEHLQSLQKGVQACTTCGMLTDAETCALCRDPERDSSLLCVVESTLDVLALERTGEFHGRYHVLGGVLSPLDRVGPDDLRIASLFMRVQAEHPTEIILALNPSLEGETTALYLRKLLAEEPVTLSRLAQGLPTGAAIEYADDLTLTRAFSGRQTL